MTPLTDLLDQTAADHSVDARRVDPQVAKLRKQLAETIAQRNLLRFQAEQSKSIIEGQAQEIRRLRAAVARHLGDSADDAVDNLVNPVVVIAELKAMKKRRANESKAAKQPTLASCDCDPIAHSE